MGIRDARIKLGLSQKDIAEALGVSQPTVSDWEAERKMPNKRNLIRLSKILGIGTDELLGVNHDSPLSDSSIKIALFGDADVDDKLLEEVRRFAEFAKQQSDDRS